MLANKNVEITLIDRILAHPAYLWLSENKNTFFYSALLFVALSIFGVRYFTQNSSLVAHDYVAAETAYIVLQKADSEGASSTVDDSLSDFESILSRQTHLQAKYDGLIAQALIARNLPEEAIPYGQRAIDRTKGENNPLYTQYSQTALLMAEGENERALDASLALQTSLQDKTDQYPYLVVLNTLRIAVLQQSWKEWQELASSSNEKLVAAYQSVANVFQEGSIGIESLVN